MDDTNKIKRIVKKEYSPIVKNANRNKEYCCDCGTQADADYTVFNDSYQGINGYVSEADLGLGCGLPTEFAHIQSGETVVDLGSGAGNDVFIARRLVGDSGKVIGIDITPEMIQKAEENNRKLGYTNVEFKLGEIEALPLSSESVDIVISNCVINLIPDKKKVFQEIFRILTPGGRFCISDVVIQGNLPFPLQKSAEMYAGCVAGAMQLNKYLDTMREAGFIKIEIKKKKRIRLPVNMLKKYLHSKEIDQMQKDNIGIFSITITGFKDSLNKKSN